MGFPQPCSALPQWTLLFFFFFYCVSANVTLIWLNECARTTTTKHQTLHKSAAFLRVPVHPSTTDSSMRWPYNEISKQYTPFYNFRRHSQIFQSTLKSHESWATHWHWHGFLNFQAKLPNNHFAKRHFQSSNNPSLSPRACWKPNESPSRAGTGSERRLG